MHALLAVHDDLVVIAHPNSYRRAPPDRRVTRRPPHLLSGARVVTEEALGNDVVGLDTEVTYRELPGGARRTVTLVHPASADASKARISVFAPVGRALLGRRAGVRVPVALPNGAIDELHVLAVERTGRPS